MPDIRAFRGYRYDLGKVGSLADVLCPPYDVIDATLQEALLHASPYNAIHLELTPAAASDTNPDTKYTRAATTLREWTHADVLKQDTARNLYVYEQEYTVEGVTHIRRGFLARVRLEPFGSGKIYPHEQTLAGPKADRLKLYRATQTNISPVFGLYPDDGTVFATLEPAIRNQPPIVATDHLGVINRFWLVNDTHTVSQVVGLMGPKPVFIADGHHRYETGLKYLEEQREAGLVQDEESPANYCLMMLVGMNDPGLLILPTHRLLSGLPNITAEQLKATLAPEFDIVAQYTTAAECWEHLQMDGSQAVLGFGTVADGAWLVAKLRSMTTMDTLAAQQSEDWRSLAVSILHKLVIEKLLAEAFPAETTCRYVHLLQEVNDAVAAQDCQLACLVPPCEMEHVESIAGNLEKMPPKSTYFYPKILTGLVLHSLKHD